MAGDDAGLAAAGRAVAGHRLLHALVFAVPLSGWVYSSAAGVSVVHLDIVPLPNSVAKDRDTARWLLVVHQALNFTLAAAVAVHIGAALKHRLIDRDGVLARATC